MNHITTMGVVLRRVNYQEADRIVRLITPDHGKISLIAKGARRTKSKLAGGIELFSVNDITFIKGKSEIFTLVSSRGANHFQNILKDLERTKTGFEFIKRIDKLVEDNAGGEYFQILANAFEGLDRNDISSQLVEAWFLMKIFDSSGHGIELDFDADSKGLKGGSSYDFDHDTMAFYSSQNGVFSEQHIKLMRLLRSSVSPLRLVSVQGVDDYVIECVQLCRSIDKFLT